MVDELIQLTTERNCPLSDPGDERDLKNTYGLLVYQEQIMQLAPEACWIHSREADLMLRAMGKKNARNGAS